MERVLAPSRAANLLHRAAHPISGGAEDFDGLIELAADRQVVLIGEASHGTHEFYDQRARIPRRLIEECGFTAVAAVEADWPDAYRANRFVMGDSTDSNAHEALPDFTRFPTWMWRNTVTMHFLDWMRAYNDNVHARTQKARFYGLDLDSLRASIEAVIEYLDRVASWVCPINRSWQ